MKLFGLALLFIIPSMASAGPLSDRAYRLAAQIGNMEYQLTPAQSTQINRAFDSIQNALSAPPAPERNYICVSRDNDNSRPYMFAYKDFANIVRIQGTIINSKEECEKSLAAAARTINRDRAFACASRDNDGSRPFQIVALNGGSTGLSLQRSVLGSLDDCTTATQSMQIRQEGVLYCGSKDNDGSRPFAQTGYRFNGSFEQGRDEYSTLSDCISNL